MLNAANRWMILIAKAQNASGEEQSKQKNLTNVLPSDISKEINSGIQHEVPWDLLLVGLGATLMAIVFISAQRWWKARQEDPSPLVLYSAVARKAGLSWSERLLLWRVARACELPTPIALLLARGTLRHHTSIYARGMGPRQAGKLAERIGQIEHRLFG